MNKPIYLDYMSTTPIDPRVIQKMLPYLEEFFGNPASKHFYGYQAKAAIEKARIQVASLINCNPKNIIWTSGATEANNLALKGGAFFYKRQGKHILTCKTEHKSVLDTCKYLETQGFDITFLSPESDGLIDLEKFKKSLRQDTIMVSIMHVNNEIGTIQDITNISEITHSKGILLHVDSAQGAGKIPINLKESKIDLMSFSAHKVYGPKGIGALYINNSKLHLMPQIHGGSQENNLRAGTLATHQIVGMGEAFSIAEQEMIAENARILSLQKKLINGIKNLENIYINGSLESRIPGNLNLSFAKISGKNLILELKDLAISTTSACVKDITELSYVLREIGVSEELNANSIRLSIGRFTTELEIDLTIEHLNKVITYLRKNEPQLNK
jgi:cysteine desulfurase